MSNIISTTSGSNDYFFSKEEWIEYNHYDSVTISPDENDSCLRVKYLNKVYYDKLCEFGNVDSEHSRSFILNMFPWFNEPNTPVELLGSVCLADGSRVKRSYDNISSDVEFTLFNKFGQLVRNVSAFRTNSYYYHTSVVGAATDKHGTEYRGISDDEVIKYPYITLQSDKYTMPAIIVDCDLPNSVSNYWSKVSDPVRPLPPCSYYIENRDNGHAQFCWFIKAVDKSISNGCLEVLYNRIWLTLTILLGGDVHFTCRRFQNPYFWGMETSNRHIVVPDAENGYRLWSLQGLVCDLHNRGLLIPESELAEKYGYKPFKPISNITRLTKFDVWGLAGITVSAPIADTPTTNALVVDNTSTDNRTSIDTVKDKDYILHSGRTGLNPKLFKLKSLYPGCRYVGLFRILTYVVWHNLRQLLLSTQNVDDLGKIVERAAFNLRDLYCVDSAPLPDCEIRTLSKQVSKYFISKTKGFRTKTSSNSLDSELLAADLLTNIATSGSSESNNITIPTVGGVRKAGYSSNITPEQHEILVRMGRNGGRAKTVNKRNSSAKNIKPVNDTRKIGGYQTAIKAFHAVNKWHTIGMAAKKLKMARQTVRSAFKRYYSCLVNNVEVIVEDFINKNNFHHVCGNIRRNSRLQPIFGLSALFFMGADASFNTYAANMLEKLKNEPTSGTNIAGTSRKFDLNVIVDSWLNTRVAMHAYLVYRNLILFALIASSRSRYTRWNKDCSKARKMFIKAIKTYKFDGSEYDDYANNMFEDIMVEVFETMTADKNYAEIAEKILDNAVYKKRIFDNMPVVKNLLNNYKLMDRRTFEIIV